MVGVGAFFKNKNITFLKLALVNFYNNALNNMLRLRGIEDRGPVKLLL